MTKMEVKENKKLILKNVILKKFENIEMQNVDRESSKLLNEMKILNVQTFGPLVTKVSGHHIHEDGSFTMDYELMLQAHDYKQYKEKYIIKDRIEFSHCVYVRFQGEPENIQFAHSKLELYFYEENLVSDGITISIIVSETPDEITVDLFKPVVQL